MKLAKFIAAAAIAAAIATPSFAADEDALIARVAELEAQVAAFEAERALTARHLEIFDELDLEAFNSRDMERIGEIHAENVIVYTLMQVILGPLIGIGLGYMLARILDASINAGFITISCQGIYFLVAAFLAFVTADLVGGNGLIAAFVGGLVFGNTLKNPVDFIEEFMESEGQLLTIFTFLIFGAVMVPKGIEHATWKTLVLAVLYLTVIRMLPIWLSLTGSGLNRYEKMFLGWFGPRGLASILFALLFLERFQIPGGDEILACVVLTVMLSIVLHGVSANPMSARFGRGDDG